jgi:hypothetical protein
MVFPRSLEWSSGTVSVEHCKPSPQSSHASGGALVAVDGEPAPAPDGGATRAVADTVATTSPVISALRPGIAGP